MESASGVFSFLATVALGLSAGALLVEAKVLVPFWRGLAPAEFLAWYRQNAALLLRFFGPLEVVAAVVAIMAWVFGWLGASPGQLPRGGAALLAVLVLLLFPVYFQRVNASFASGSIAPESVGPELARWSLWHGARTLIGALAFALSVISG